MLSMWHTRAEVKSPFFFVSFTLSSRMPFAVTLPHEGAAVSVWLDGCWLSGVVVEGNIASGVR